MEQRKMNFFKRAKNAIIDFDSYKNFAEEKLFIAVKYLLKVVLIFTIAITIALSIKLVNETNKAIQIFKNEFPEFKFENNILILEGDNKQFIKGHESGLFGIVVDSEKENLSQIEQANGYQTVIALLKNKIIIKNVNNIESAITYESLNQKYEIQNINKQAIIDFTSSNYMIQAYAIFIPISILYLFVIYLIQILIDALLLSVIAFLLSKIVGIKLSYKSIFNMSIYALTLSIILYMIYIVVNLFTGFEIIYFDIAYDGIAYIYIITAMLMIKSDLIKQQIEVGRIVQEQKKIREEKEQEENKEKDKEEKKEDKENKKQKKDNNKEEGTPEGSKA